MNTTRPLDSSIWQWTYLQIWVLVQQLHCFLEVKHRNLVEATCAGMTALDKAGGQLVFGLQQTQRTPDTIVGQTVK